MTKWQPEKIRLGVSACLLGERVRYDGGHKRDAFLVDTLGPFVEWVPTCPEVEIGLAVPRPTLRLVGAPAAPRLMVERTREDLSARMHRWAAARVRTLDALGLDGYVLKRGSPSCGLERVPVHADAGGRRGAGRGLFAAALLARFPGPVEEEGRLTDAAIRESFIERVFAAARWRTFLASDPGPGDLVTFHATHKFAVLAHSPAGYAALGRLVASAGARDRGGSRHGRLATVLAEYGDGLARALAVRATRARHVNVLQHLAGFLARDLDAADRGELADVIAEYRRGLVPLVVPVTLLRHHVRRLGLAYLADQVYLAPHPKELMLRNHV